MAINLTTSYQMLGQKKLGTNYGNLYIRIYAKYNSQSAENNTSSVTYQSRLYYDGGGGSTYIISQGSTKVVTSGDGATSTTTGWKNFEGRQDGYYYTGETIVKTITGTVSHDSNGDASVTTSAAFSSSGSWGWSGTASGVGTLPNIPRASTITATSAYIEEVSQLTIYQYNPSYTHSIKYSFGSEEGYILSNGSTTSTETKISSTSIGFTLPSSFYNVIPNASSGVCTLLIKTYYGDTQIGDTQISQFRASVNPETNSPTISATFTDTNQTAINLTGSNQIFIKNFSIVNISWSATPKNGASISSVTINGNSAATNPYSLSLSDDTINIIAIDTRGFSTTYTATNTIKDYNFASFTIDGSRPSPTSLNADVLFSGSWWNNNFGAQNNSIVISWKYKKTSDSTWIAGGTLVNGTDYSVSGDTFVSGTSSSPAAIQVGGALDYAYSWDVAIDVTDKITTISRNVTIPKGIPIVNWDNDDWYFNVNALSEIYAPHDFTSTDVTKIENYIAGTGTLTNEELILYDVNEDDAVDNSDLAIINSFIKYNVTTASPMRVLIPNSKNVVSSEIILEDGNNNQLTKIGLDAISGQSITSHGTYTLSGDGLSLTDNNNNTITINTGWLPKQVLTSWFSTTAETITNGMSHALFVIVGRASSGAYRNSIIIPTASIPSSNTLYQLTDDVNYFSFYLMHSGNNIIITGHQRSSGGYIESAWLLF